MILYGAGDVILYGEADDVFYAHHVPACWHQVATPERNERKKKIL